MSFQITLGDIIGWIITVASVGIAVTLNIKVTTRRNGDTKKVNQSKSHVMGDQIGGDKNGR